MSEWDVFVSHATEDKVSFVEPLVRRLQKHVKVWIDSTEIRPGDSIRRKMDYGLANSRWGVIVLSRNFFSPKKTWTQDELDGLFSTNRTRIIPVRLRITRTFLAERSPFLSGMRAIMAGDGIPSVASQIVKRITNGALYNQPEYARRLEAMVTTGTARSTPLYVAIGKGDWASSWLPRLVERLRNERIQLKISRLIILSLDPIRASSMESIGELEPGFTQTMLKSIEDLKDRFPGPTECRVWGRAPEFHGYLHGQCALVAEWARDARGHLHVMTSLKEVQRDHNSEEFDRIVNAFKQAPPPP
jgi:hypothetical protein